MIVCDRCKDPDFEVASILRMVGAEYALCGQCRLAFDEFLAKGQWGHILRTLPAGVRALWRNLILGTTFDQRTWIFVAPSARHLEVCRARLPEVQRTIAEYLGRDVEVLLTLDTEDETR